MADYYVYLHSPVTIFAAQINMASVSYPLTSLTFDNVTTGTYDLIEADMTLVLGSAAGLDDLGRVRVQNIATSTTIPIPRTSQGTHDGELDVVDNAYVAVWADYRVWSKQPYIADDGTMYKDTNVPLGDFGAEPPPVANCGPGFAATIDPDTSVITASFAAGNSFAVADGATIDTYAWDVDDGTLTSGTSASANITATFPAGFRWVALTVTDSNGHSHSARCPVYARDPDDDTTLPTVNIERHHVEQGGQELDLRIVEDLPRSTYPDGTLVLFWRGEPLSASDRTHMEFVGWHQADDAEVRANRTGNTQGTVLHCVDVAGRLKTLPGFPQELRRAATPAGWDEMVNPTMDKYLHYILQWHSTALSLADYFPSDTGDDYPFVIFASDGESLFDQVQDEARALMPTHQLECDRQGRLKIVADQMLRDSADRTSTLQGSFTEAFTTEIRFSYTRPPRVHWLRGHALLTGTDYVTVDGVDTLPTVHCIAPGTAPGQGLNEVITNEGLARSQAALNSTKGHEYARRNSRYGPVTVTKADDDAYEDIQATSGSWVGLYLSAANAAQRGDTWTQKRTQCKAIDFRYQQTRTGVVRRSEWTLEIETVGKPALTVIPEGTTYEPYVPGGPPSFGIITGQESVAAISRDGKLYTTTDFQTASGDGGPTWTETDLEITDTKLFSFVVDPFSPGYINQDGTGAINGWVAGESNIWRITDMLGTPAATVVHTFATTISASSVFVSRTINASFGRFFATDSSNPWLLCVSHYADASGHTGTWATYSVDAGATWSDEVQISAGYDADLSGDDPANVPALWLSPRTPGLARSAAYVTNGDASLPIFALWPDGGSLSIIGAGNQGSMSHTASDTPGGDSTSAGGYLIVAPPKNTKRIALTCAWTTSRDQTGLSSSFAAGIAVRHDASITRTGSQNYTAPANHGSGSGSFDVTFEFAGGDWPVNNESIISSPPASQGGCALDISLAANAVGTGNVSTITIGVTWTVTEIELDDGTIYTPAAGAATAGFISTDWGATWTESAVIAPGDRLSGDYHVPWDGNSDENIMYYGALDRSSNLAYALKRVGSDGTTVTDISPVVSSRTFGVNAANFGVRAYDSDRQKVLLAGRGNSATSDTDDDYVAVFVSSDAGDTWTAIVAPSNSTDEYRGAFGGDDSDVIFLYGPPGYISYSSDFGANLDDRSGNLSSDFSPASTIGIAGGPLGA